MKIITKIASLTLLTLCLQVDAAQYSPGINGLKTTCAVFMRSGNLKVSGPASAQFKTAYGLDAKEVCPYLSDIDAIQTFIDNNFNAGAGQFNTAKDAQGFADLVGTQSYLFAGNIFPLVGGQTYYQIATAQIENEVKTQTATATNQAAALTTIATSVATLRGTAAPAGGAAVDLADITAKVAAIDKAEGVARSYLNTLSLKWNPAINIFDAAPTTRASDLGAFNIAKYIETTFAGRLQFLLPVADPTFAPILALAQDPAALALDTTLLNPVTTPKHRDYSATEAQADAVIKAMANQITLTNTELDGVAGVTGVIPAGPLSVKASYILTHMKGAIVTAKGAIATALNGVMALAGYVPPAAVGGAAPVIDEVALATAAATAITATEAQLVRVAALAPTYVFTAAQTTLPQRTTALLTHLNTNLNTALTANTATDAELTRVAATLVPVFALPVGGTLQARATALLGKLSAGGGSAGITAYLDATLANSLYASLNTPTPPNPSLIDQMRAAINLPTSIAAGTANKKRLQAALDTDKKQQFTGIIEGLNADPIYSTAATAEDKVKAAITYLTTQLYQSYMWLNMTQELTSAPGLTPLTFAAVPNVPAYSSGPSSNVAAAAQNRITALIGAIKALHAQNAALTIAAAAARIAGGAAGAETDANVVAVTAEIEKLAGQLAACGTVMGGATAAAKLPLLTPAVTQMANALTVLSAGIAAGLPAADGAALATAIKAQIETATATAFKGQLTAFNADTLSSFITLPAAPGLTEVKANAQILLNIIQTLAHSAGIKDTAGAAIPAVNAAGPFVLAANKLAPATLAAAIEKGITDKVVIPVAPVVAPLNFTGADTLRINGLTTAGLQATPATANAFIDSSITALADLVTKSGVAAPFVNVNALSTECLAALSRTTDLTTQVQRDVAAALINSALNAELGLTALPATFNLAALTTDAPTAGATLGDVGNYLRQCALAANELKVLAGLTVTPPTMQDLMTQSATAIRDKFAAAAPAPVVAPAAAAAVIPQAVIDGHNTSLKFLVALFNAGRGVAAKNKYALTFDPLNKAAAAINALNPPTKALVITQNGPVTAASQATFA